MRELTVTERALLALSKVMESVHFVQDEMSAREVAQFVSMYERGERFALVAVPSPRSLARDDNRPVAFVSTRNYKDLESKEVYQVVEPEPLLSDCRYLLQYQFFRYCIECYVPIDEMASALFFASLSGTDIEAILQAQTLTHFQKYLSVLRE